MGQVSYQVLNSVPINIFLIFASFFFFSIFYFYSACRFNDLNKIPCYYRHFFYSK